ncbi:MAG: four helix bundle protein [Roseivirga sp.]|jgi:four helix bundle protein
MSSFKDFTELEVWIQSKNLAKSIYQITSTFPQKESFRLTDQMCRAAVSIPSNIAEGLGRNTMKDKAHFFYIARGSAFEVETQMHIAFDLSYIDEENLNRLKLEILSVKKLINGFLAFLKKPKNQTPKT